LEHFTLPSIVNYLFSDLRISQSACNSSVEGELQENATCKDFLQVQTEGSRKNEKLLFDAGSVSHQQAIEKAKDEFRKYRLKTLSPLEKVYLENIKAVQKKLRREKKKMNKIDELIAQY